MDLRCEVHGRTAELEAAKNGDLCLARIAGFVEEIERSKRKPTKCPHCGKKI